MRNFTIAVIPGDGVGQEVIPEGTHPRPNRIEDVDLVVGLLAEPVYTTLGLDCMNNNGPGKPLVEKGRPNGHL